MWRIIYLVSDIWVIESSKEREKWLYTTRDMMKADFYDISHPDVDNGLRMYFNDDEYCFKSRKYDEVMYYAILKKRDNSTWKVLENVESSEVDMFNDDDLNTAIIEKIVSKRESRKPFILIAIIGLIILIPVLIIGYTVLGLDTMTEYGMGYIITGIVMVPLLPVALNTARNR